MKPFDIEAAKRGEPYTIRGSNNPHTFLRVMKRGDREQIIGVFVESNGDEYATILPPEELCMLPRKETRWVVTWRRKDDAISIGSGAYESEASATTAMRDYSKSPHRHSFSINEIEVEV